MRVASTFGQRTLSRVEKKEKSKIYLMYEGEKTEVQYFNALINFLNSNNSNFLFEPIILLRSFKQRSNSHPKNIIEQIQRFTKERGKYKYLPDILIDYCIYQLHICESKYSEDEVIEIIEKMCSEILKIHNADDSISVEDVLSYLQQLFLGEFSTESQIRHFINYLKEQTTFQLFPNDRVCLIIDGDHKSVREQSLFEELIKLTRALNIELYVSNPNFEFWLLLHTDNIKKYKNKKLLENVKVNSHKRYLETVLSKEFDGYNKSNIRPERFIVNIDIALNNSKNYCRDINKLNSELGTNVCELILSMIDKESLKNIIKISNNRTNLS